MLLIAVRVLWAQTDGSSRWSGAFSTGGVIVSSPAVGADGTIYFGSEDKYLYAVNSSGALKWRYKTGDWVDSSPAIGSDGTIYFGSWDGTFYALNTNGTLKWSYTVGASCFIFSSPAIGSDGTLYFGAGDGNLYALRSDGTLKWTYAAGDWIDSSPAIGENGFIYYGSWDGYVYAVADEGSYATEMWHFQASEPVLGSPALGEDGTVYIGSNGARLYALDGTTGVKRWEYATGDAIQSSPAIGPDGTIYCGSFDGYLVALGSDGSLKWRFGVGDAIVSTPAVRGDGTIVFGAGNCAVYALNPDGSQKWKVSTGDWVDSSPVVASNGTIYVGCYDKKLYAFYGSGSPPSGLSCWPMFRHDSLHSGLNQALDLTGRLMNLSTRALAGGGNNLIPGFVLSGSGSRSLLIRAVGPSLQQFSIDNYLAAPQLALYSGSNTVLARNESWSSSADVAGLQAAFSSVGAFSLLADSKDAALLVSLSTGAYTALVTSGDGTEGLALVEIYDADSSDSGPRLVNLSARGHVGTGDYVLTPGLVIGSGSLRLLIRAVGPGLKQFGVSGTVEKPTISVFSGTTTVAINTGWSNSLYSADIAAAAARVGAFSLASGSDDSATLITLAAGAYTVQVSGVGETTGEALVEIYVVP